MKKFATEHYTSRRGNCAQAVALAWKDKQPEPDYALRRMRRHRRRTA